MKTFLLLAVLTSLLAAQIPFFDFPDSLYERNRPQLDSILSYTASKNLKAHDLPDTEENREQIRSLLFLHHLFTSGADMNGNYGGILQIPYFWHWCSNNPRHDIRFMPAETTLTAIKPPQGFEKYKSLADVDRTPYLYLSDLAEDYEKYYHNLVGEMFTFGWCSEREMAFGQILTQRGYTMKVYQNSSHVWSEVLVPFYTNEEKQSLRVIRIDNTFDYFDMVELESTSAEWLADIGEGSMKKWYNKMATDKTETKKIATLMISARRFDEMNSKVLHWVNSFRKEKS